MDRSTRWFQDNTLEGQIRLLTFQSLSSELPSNLVLKKISPKIWLPVLSIAWGIVTMCLGFVRGFSSFLAVRAILGLCEGGLLPGMVLYLSGLYNRGELALRIGIFYTAASLSGAFGGGSYIASDLHREWAFIKNYL